MALEPYRETPTSESRIRMRVVCRPEKQALPDGANASKGENIVEVNASSEQAVMDMVEEHPEWIEEARAHYEGKFRTHLLESGHPDPDKVDPAVLKRAKAEFGWSTEASFYEQRQRGIKPLVLAEVIERDIPPPHVEHEFRSNQKFIADVIPALGKAIAEAIKSNEGNRQAPRR